jgi:hypothetical protein
MRGIFALLALVLAAAAGAVTAAAAAERFPILQPEQMNAEQAYSTSKRALGHAIWHHRMASA